jgi:hypothetical protein
MFYREHAPRHYHAVYGEYQVSVEVETQAISGIFPKWALALVLEWHNMHKEELIENWNLAQQRRPLKKIAPLE